MATDAYWLNVANHNDEYARWLQRVDELCDQLLDLRFADLIYEADFDTADPFFTGGMRPERFVGECVIPYLQSEHGVDTIYEVIAENALWGGGIQDEY